MGFRGEISQVLTRKIITSSIAGSLFAILLGLFVPNPFGEDISSIGVYFQGFVISVPVYLMYSFPVILLYGTITSTISDYVARVISNYTNRNFKLYFSIILHILFGLILLWYSLLASFLYFITDYILSKRGTYKWNNALKSIGIPALVWILFMWSVYIIG
ncbi:hypothetical protein [Virgibacillus halodenitrificans]|uniref:hypothetical protein n=1 Tax=Virgibacillus halodenitrificans TaxID=1482 RepID=UPI002DBCB209|nr:hypothetical protein [Virgibacillus halodenitrificans]MEC2158482.1 hypothetical protein [Virgibacillus halodenitrificans]